MRDEDGPTSPAAARRSSVAAAIGVALIVASAVLAPPLLLNVLGVAGKSGTVWLGAALFRLGVAALGAYLVVAGRLRIWRGDAPRPVPSPPRSGWEWAALAGILATALGLRLHRLGEGLWYDEINVRVLYMGMSFGEILTTYQSESQHFPFTLLARACFALFGEGPASLRLPAALFGAGSVAALYLLARQVTSPREALLSAGLLTVSYHHVWFS
jgi:mannosyltransferase